MVIYLLILCHIQLIGKNHRGIFQIAEHLSRAGGLNLRLEREAHIELTAAMQRQIKRLRGVVLKNAVERLHLRQQLRFHAGQVARLHAVSLLIQALVNLWRMRALDLGDCPRCAECGTRGELGGQGARWNGRGVHGGRFSEECLLWSLQKLQ